MSTKPQPPLNQQSILLAIWLASVSLSLALYWDRLFDAFDKASNVCTTKGLGEALLAFVQPAHWLGILALALTIVGVRAVFMKMSSRWSFISDYKWPALVVLAFMLTLILGFGCN